MANDGSGADAPRVKLLKRIADILEMPVGATSGPEEAGGDRPAGKARDDARAMLTAFVAIRDPERRKVCLDYALKIVDDEAAGEGRTDRA